jgi:4-hydroxy-tetrahydrodipicolinate reductase
VKALIVGPGKMGKAIEAILLARGHTVVGKIGRGNQGTTGVFLERKNVREKPGRLASGGRGAAAPRAAARSADASGASGADIAFEFTTPDAAPGLVSSYLSRKTPVLSGTTGWDTREATRISRELDVPFLHSANFSLGVAALKRAVAAAAAALAPFPEFEPGIVERHHSQKKDAPSGTAKLLAAAIGAARPGGAGVPIVSLRQAAQPGEHLVFFEGENEVVELVHRARSRAIFAVGAVVPSPSKNSWRQRPRNRARPSRKGEPHDIFTFEESPPFGRLYGPHHPVYRLRRR